MQNNNFDAVLVEIFSLVPDSQNARVHNDENMNSIIGSLKEFGQVEPLVVQLGTNIVIGGNGRLEAMKRLNFKEVAVHFVDIDDKSARALALSLNRTGELAEWNKQILGKQLLGLSREGFGIANIGFDPKQWIRSGSGNEDIVSPEFNPKITPEDKKESKDKKLTLLVECESMEALENLFSELNERGFKVKL